MGIQSIAGIRHGRIILTITLHPWRGVVIQYRLNLEIVLTPFFLSLSRFLSLSLSVSSKFEEIECRFAIDWSRQRRLSRCSCIANPASQHHQHHHQQQQAWVANRY